MLTQYKYWVHWPQNKYCRATATVGLALAAELVWEDGCSERDREEVEVSIVQWVVNRQSPVFEFSPDLRYCDFSGLRF